MARDRKLIELARAFTPPGDSLVAAFHAVKGVRPGTEVLGLLGMLFVPGTGSLLAGALLAGMVGGLIAVLIMLTRTCYLVAVTEQPVVLIRCRRLRLSPIRIEQTLASWSPRTDDQRERSFRGGRRQAFVGRRQLGG